MELLFILGLVVVVIILHDRTRRLEQRITSLEDLGITASHAAPAAKVAPDPEIRTAPAEDTAQEPQVEPLAAFDPPAETQSSDPLEPAEPQRPPEPLGAEREAVEPVDPDTQPARQFDFEDIFGRRLPIWAGGIALAVGGIFLALYSIEAGLLGPKVRVALSFVFGALLLVAAEVAHRFPERVKDTRVRQALAGAGIATFYAAFYLAGAQYELIGPGVAFGGLALVTAGALGLTFRFGLPTAVLGLLGGFATPVMVASEEANVPILAFYLALLTAGLALTARRLGNRWLGAAALAGGFAWGGLMLLGGPAEGADRIAIGVYLLALGAAIPVVVERDSIVPLTRVISGAIGAVQLGVLVALAGFDLLTWGLYLLLAAALAVLSWRSEALRPANVLALALGVILLGAWPEPVLREFVLVAGALAGIGLGLPLALLWRDRATALDLAQLSIGALALAWVCHFHFGTFDNEITQPGLALTFAALAAAVAGGALRIWRTGGALDQLLALPIAASALLGFGALHMLLPDWAEVLGAVAVTLVLAELMRRRHRKTLSAVAWAGAAFVLVTLLSTGDNIAEMERGFGSVPYDHNLTEALIRWGAAVLPFLALLMVEWRAVGRRIGETVFALFAYVWLAQIVPGQWLAWTAALGALAALWWLPRRTGLWAAPLALGALWGLTPLLEWCAAAFEALAGLPMLVSDLPTPSAVLRHIIPLALAAGFASWKLADDPRLRRGLFIAASLVGAIGVHILFKQAFALSSAEEFARLGMAERTIWQALLVGTGIAVLRFRPEWRVAGASLLSAGLGHFTLFTFTLHNPLWSTQAVGTMPVASWLLPAYGVAGVGAYWLFRQGPEALQAKIRHLGDAAIMLLISFFALSELRHNFAGSVLTAVPMTQTEDLLRSLTGILLALGFLWWGSRTGQRSWRIGSLVLMLLAVLKVFLFDAAGLEDLKLVASFVALGFSLLGIGIVYSRQLSSRTKSQ